MTSTVLGGTLEIAMMMRFAIIVLVTFPGCGNRAVGVVSDGITQDIRSERDRSDVTNDDGRLPEDAWPSRDITRDGSKVGYDKGPTSSLPTALWKVPFAVPVGGAAIDSAGNALVAASFSINVYVGAELIAPKGMKDAILVKYDPSGKPLWFFVAAGPGYEASTGVAVDAAGNIYWVGSFSESTSFATTMLSSNGSTDLFVAKIDPNGKLVWVTTGGGAGTDELTRVAADDGGAMVIGHFEEAVTLAGQPLSTSASGGLVARISSTGQWISAAAIASTQNAYAWDIAVDQAGSYFIAGTFEGQSNFTGSVLASSGKRDVFVARYNAPSFTWAWRGGGSSNDEGRGIGIGGAGELAVTGFFEKAASFGGFTLDAVPPKDTYPPSARDAFVLTMNPATGTVISATALGDNGPDMGLGVAFVGLGEGRLLRGDGGGTSPVCKYGCTYLTRFSASGNLGWSHLIQSSAITGDLASSGTKLLCAAGNLITMLNSP